MIKKTKDYEIFKKHESNRELVPANLKRLTFSISTRNLLGMRPILVNGKMEVIDGQHRLEIAKKLGLEIYYEMQEQLVTKDMYLLNENQSKWKFDDYIHYYCNEGNVNYIKFKYFTEENNLSAFQALILLQEAVVKENMGSAVGVNFKAGKFIFPAEEKITRKKELLQKANEVLDRIGELVVEKGKFLANPRFKRAIIFFIGLPDVDCDVFIGKLHYKVGILRPQSSWHDYVNMFCSIYNWKNQLPVSLEL
jgi:hypothetical protein